MGWPQRAINRSGVKLLTVFAPLLEPARGGDQHAHADDPRNAPDRDEQLIFHHFPPEGRYLNHRSAGQPVLPFFAAYRQRVTWPSEQGARDALYFVRQPAL